jgi:hypothetical protein
MDLHTHGSNDLGWENIDEKICCAHALSAANHRHVGTDKKDRGMHSQWWSVA